MSITRDIRMALRGTYGALIRLIVINVVVFLGVNIFAQSLIIYGYRDVEADHPVSYWVALPSGISDVPGRIWTLFTYMFVHFGLLHILSNMLWLYFLGRVFSDLLGGARLTAVYIIGGLAGGLLFIAGDAILPGGGNHSLVGASAGVTAIVVAAAAFSPDYTMFPFGQRMKLKWVALIMIVLTTLIGLSENTGGKVAHMGGAIFGFIYGARMRTRGNFMEGFTGLFRKKSGKLRVEHSRSRSARTSDEVYVEQKLTIRKRVDEILDKISRSGYDSLTREEKNFLQKNHDKF